MTIHERIHNAIKPALDRADELLDHYLANAPTTEWVAIATQILEHDHGYAMPGFIAKYDDPNQPVPPVPVRP